VGWFLNWIKYGRSAPTVLLIIAMSVASIYAVDKAKEWGKSIILNQIATGKEAQKRELLDAVEDYITNRITIEKKADNARKQLNNEDGNDDVSPYLSNIFDVLRKR